MKDITVAQIGLGKFGSLRAWAWSELDVNLIACDPKPPPSSRLPPNCVLAGLEEIRQSADIISIAVPPSEVFPIVWDYVDDGKPLVFVEKPGACDFEDIQRLYGYHKNTLMSFTALYDQCLWQVVKEAKDLPGVHYESHRLHSAALHEGTTVLEDLVIHDLAVADVLGVLGTGLEANGTFPYDVQVFNDDLFINASAKSPNRVRFARMAVADKTWNIFPDQFALCSDGRSIPPSQARPLYKECESVVKVLRGEMKAEDHLGNSDRVFRVWQMIDKIRKVWR